MSCEIFVEDGHEGAVHMPLESNKALRDIVNMVVEEIRKRKPDLDTVSYTHLTLPTICSV